jgi:hypothetical protein
MSNIILYTTDENTPTGIREASFQEVLDAARSARSPSESAAEPASLRPESPQTTSE